MTKKNIVLVLILSIFFTVMAISVWGKNPEPSNKIPADSMVFYDEAGQEITTINEHSMDREKIVKLNVDEDEEVTFCFSCDILPENTTDPYLSYKFVYGEGEIEELILPDSYRPVDSKSTGSSSVEPQHSTHYHFVITFGVDQQTSAKLKFTYNTQSVTKNEYLLFTWSEVHEDDVK